MGKALDWILKNWVLFLSLPLGVSLHPSEPILKFYIIFIVIIAVINIYLPWNISFSYNSPSLLLEHNYSLIACGCSGMTNSYATYLRSPTGRSLLSLPLHSHETNMWPKLSLCAALAQSVDPWSRKTWMEKSCCLNPIASFLREYPIVLPFSFSELPSFMVGPPVFLLILWTPLIFLSQCLVIIPDYTYFSSSIIIVVQVLVSHIAIQIKLLFLRFFRQPRLAYMIKFWSVGCNLKWYVQIPESILKKKGHTFFFLPFPHWLEDRHNA